MNFLTTILQLHYLIISPSLTTPLRSDSGHKYLSHRYSSNGALRLTSIPEKLVVKHLFRDAFKKKEVHMEGHCPYLCLPPPHPLQK